MSQVEIAIVGAGIAGLTCAHLLHHAGYSVVVLEKSRGVGGRLATRRSQDSCMDHGTGYVVPHREMLQDYLNFLSDQAVVQVWTDTEYRLTADGRLQAPIASERVPRYVAPEGMNAIAKGLTAGLDLRFNQRVTQIDLTANQTWQLAIAMGPSASGPSASGPSAPPETATLEATAVILTPPAPQTLALLAPLADQMADPQILGQLQAVQFMPCLAVMAGYPNARSQDWATQYPGVQAIAAQHPDLAWIGLDSSKRRSPRQPVFVLHSTATFATAYLDATDLMPAGKKLLQVAATFLADWFATPEWQQVHRWRYALVSDPLPQTVLDATLPLPLLCAGDWCGGRDVDSAFCSGIDAALRMNQQLQSYPLRSPVFWRE